ncbi:hypothetical protein F5Y18DRAFT_418210 [Xylariaceae sp. FL1019]|nr:hypothetical protein F5Y18DRAFT_418210 [Xylariaceae sp. FL1019]
MKFFQVVSFATAVSGACDRALLQEATSQYLAAQIKGASDDFANTTTTSVKYTENGVPMGLRQSVLTEPIKMDHNRTVVDTVACSTFTEIIAASNTHQYVIGTRMEFNSDNKVALMESIVTDRGDWAFNATGYLYWDSLEEWTPIPTEKQDSRDTIKAAGDAYFNRFNDTSVIVPFGTPCSRLEGGASTAPLNMTGDSCTAAGMPSGLVVADRRYVIDQEMGVVDIFLGFPGLDRSQGMQPVPDSHMFRVESGKIRYIHTVSSCVQAGCGMNGTGIQLRPRTGLPVPHGIR